MSEEIDVGGIKVPAEDWEATPESIKLVLKSLLQRIETLEEKLNKNSRNSSIPPSKDGFGAKSNNQDKQKRKPLKIAKVSTLPERKVYESEDCQKLEVHEVKPSHCKNCSGDLTGEDTQPYRHQIVDIPKIEPIVTEYQLHQLECEHCGEKTRARLPAGVTAKSYGERLAAFVAFLSGESKQSHRQVSEFLEQIFGIGVRQICWAHLLRDFQAIAERSGVAQEIGESLLHRGYRLMHWWHRYKAGKMSREMLIQAVDLLRARLKQELEAAAAMDIGSKEQTPLAKTVRTCRRLLGVESALWTFVYQDGIEPTNNVAEQALRPAVIWRNLSFGAQSESGSKFVARMLTVNRSLKAQGRSVLDFLTESCIAARHGSEPPSLIPTIQAPPISATLILP